MTNAHVVAGRRPTRGDRRRPRGAGHGRLLQPRPRRRRARRRRARPAVPAVRPRRQGARRPARCSATPRTARTTSRPPGSAASSGCAAPTSTATARSSARCSRCASLVRPGNSGGPLVSDGGRGARRGLRGVGDRRRHRLRADRRAGPRERGPGRDHATARSTPAAAPSRRRRRGSRASRSSSAVKPVRVLLGREVADAGHHVLGERAEHVRAGVLEAASRGSAGSSAPITSSTGWPTGVRHRRGRSARPSARTRDRTSQRWYSSAQCDAGQSEIAGLVGRHVLVGRGSREPGGGPGGEVGAQEAARRVGQPALGEPGHLHGQHVPQRVDPVRPADGGRASWPGAGADDGRRPRTPRAGAGPRPPRRRTRPSRARRAPRSARRAP